MNEKLTLNIFTVERSFESVECDSVRLSVADSVNGSFSGTYGIRPGHAETVFSLKKGKLVASNEEKVVFSAQTSDGFAFVKKGVVNVMVESAETEK